MRLLSTLIVLLLALYSQATPINLVPNPTLGGDLGASTNAWSTAYVTNLYVNGVEVVGYYFTDEDASNFFILTNLVVNGNIIGNGASITNVSGANIQAQTIRSNAIEASTWTLMTNTGSAFTFLSEDTANVRISTNLTVTGELHATNIAQLHSNLTVLGTITGNGSGITNIAGSSIQSGTIGLGYLPSSVLTNAWAGSATISGAVITSSNLWVNNLSATNSLYIGTNSLGSVATYLNGIVLTNGSIYIGSNTVNGTTWSNQVISVGSNLIQSNATTSPSFLNGVTLSNGITSGSSFNISTNIWIGTTSNALQIGIVAGNGATTNTLVYSTNGFLNIDGDVNFIGSQAIRTTAGNLDLAPTSAYVKTYGSGLLLSSAGYKLMLRNDPNTYITDSGSAGGILIGSNLTVMQTLTATNGISVPSGMVQATNFWISGSPKWVDAIASQIIQSGGGSAPRLVNYPGTWTGPVTPQGYAYSQNDWCSFTIQCPHVLASSNSAFSTFIFEPHIHVSRQSVLPAGTSNTAWAIQFEMAPIGASYTNGWTDGVITNMVFTRTNTLTFDANSNYLHSVLSFGYFTNNALFGKSSVIFRGSIRRDVAATGDIGNALADEPFLDGIDFHVPIRTFGSSTNTTGE